MVVCGEKTPNIDGRTRVHFWVQRISKECTKEERKNMCFQFLAWYQVARNSGAQCSPKHAVCSSSLLSELTKSSWLHDPVRMWQCLSDLCHTIATQPLVVA